MEPIPKKAKVDPQDASQRSEQLKFPQSCVNKLWLQQHHKDLWQSIAQNRNDWDITLLTDDGQHINCSSPAYLDTESSVVLVHDAAGSDLKALIHIHHTNEKVSC